MTGCRRRWCQRDMEVSIGEGRRLRIYQLGTGQSNHDAVYQSGREERKKRV